jgi:hypothetical protein
VQIITQQQSIRLWILYKTNGWPVTGRTDIKVRIIDQSGTEILAATIMTETTVPGEYAYTWNTGSIAYGTQYFIYYIQDTTVLTIEEMYSDMLGDNGDGRAF